MRLLDPPILDENNKPLYMDGYLSANLDDIKKLIRRDRDYIFCVTGYEGSGKSCFTFQMARYVDPTFELSRICFSAEEFSKQVMKAEKYQCIVYDEARSGLNARRAMSSINVTLTNMLAEIRQRNLFIFIVIPNFYDLDKNIALWRARGLFFCSEVEGERGYFRYYNREAKKSLWCFYKRSNDYPIQRCSFYGRFPEWYAIPEQAYRDKKSKALKAYDTLLVHSPEVDAKEARRAVLSKLVEGLTTRGMTKKEIAEVLGISSGRLSSELKAVKVGYEATDDEEGTEDDGT